MRKAFLLSSGLGTRLGELTKNTSKCLLPICGQSLLSIWISNLIRNDIDEVLINTHWQHNQFVNFFNNYNYTNKFYLTDTINSDYTIQKLCNVIINGKKLKVNICYEPQLLGSAGTILKNKKWVNDKEPFFILYGDNLTNVNLNSMYEFHCNHKYPLTLGVFKTQYPEQCGIVDIDVNGNVYKFQEKPKHPSSYNASAGIFVADKEIYNIFPSESNDIYPLDIGYDILNNIIGKIKAYYINEFIIDIGTPESYKEANLRWNEII